MPVTTLDPKTAMIVVDLEKGIASFPTGTFSCLGETGTTREIINLLTTRSS